MQKIKILHIIDANHLSGPGKTIYNSYKYIDKSKYDMTIGVFCHEQNEYVKYLENNKIPVLKIPEKMYNLNHILSIPFVIIFLRQYIKKKQIDVIHTHGFKSDVIGYTAKLRLGVKMITTKHGYIENDLKAKFFNKLSRLVAKRMEGVIAVSENTKSLLLKKGLPQEKVHTIHNGIVSGDYINTPVSEELREKYELGDKSPVIGCIGRISPEKGQRFLIEAFLKFREVYENSVLLLVGDGPDKEKLRLQYQNYKDSIIFTGFQKDVKAYIKLCDFTVLPSLTEGLPNVLLEAGLLEVPTIATDVGGSSECVINNETGILIEAGNVEELSQAMIKLWSNKKLLDDFRVKSKNYVMRQFDFSQRMRKIEELYEKILAEHNPCN